MPHSKQPYMRVRVCVFVFVCLCVKGENYFLPPYKSGRDSVSMRVFANHGLYI